MKVYFVKSGFEAIGALDFERIEHEYSYHKIHIEDIATFKGLLKWAD